MKKTTLNNSLLISTAIILAAGAAWLSINYLEQQEQDLRSSLLKQDQIKRPVVVATRMLKPGDVVSERNMSIREIPEDFIPDNAISPKQFASVKGATLLEPMSPGKPLIGRYLASSGVQQFSDLLKPGERAVTIDVDSRMSSESMIRPGDHVDLHALINSSAMNEAVNKAAGGNKGDTMLIPLLSNILVLATGKITVDDNLELIDKRKLERGYSTLTLALSTRDAARVTLAQKKGDIVAMLRNRSDNSMKSKFKELTLEEALYGTKKDDGGQVQYFLGGKGGQGSVTTEKRSVININNE